MKIVRVFPRRTKATPIDEDAYVGEPTLFAEADEVHISVTFSWDKPKAERLAKQWERIAPVKLGGVAYGASGGDFIPGRYLKHGYVITSRGCPNKCWFCDVWKREGNIMQELPIMEGNNVCDDNLLACSDKHIKAVFKMLDGKKQIQFTGGLEAARLKDWHIDGFSKLKANQLFFAYDTPDDLEPLIIVGTKLKEAGYSINKLRCFVLIGYPKDTPDKAEKRLIDTVSSGFLPMAMLFRDKKGETSSTWRKFQRLWATPFIIKTRIMTGQIKVKNWNKPVYKSINLKDKKHNF